MMKFLDKFVFAEMFVAVCLIPTDLFEKYCETHIGYDGHEGGQWVFPFSYLVELLKRMRNGHDVKEAVNQMFNFDVGDRGFKICLLIDNATKINFRAPTKNTQGINSDWVDGGLTKGGVPECIVDRRPVKDYIVLNSNHLDIALERIFYNLSV